MDPDTVPIVKEALRTRLRDETLERAVGRTVRRRGLDFARYITVMSDLRELALSRKTTVDEAARSLSEDEHDDH